MNSRFYLPDIIEQDNLTFETQYFILQNQLDFEIDTLKRNHSIKQFGKKKVKIFNFIGTPSFLHLDGEV